MYERIHSWIVFVQTLHFAKAVLNMDSLLSTHNTH